MEQQMDGDAIKGLGEVNRGNGSTAARVFWLKILAREVERLRSEEVVEPCWVGWVERDCLR